MSSPIAHASIALLVKSTARKAPLWIFLLATQIPEVLFYVFEFIGFEHQADVHVDLINGFTYLKPAYIPWSHGLFMCFVWSALMALVVFLSYRRFRESVIAGLMVLSHWLLDFICYDNLPLFLKGSPDVGLGLVKSPIGVKVSIAIEVISVLGVLIYAIAFFIKKRRSKKYDIKIRETNL
jgi:membrane-bound metal-dependent hydrolase YbcI (DUF457 family)